jgi:hypothetical protein
VARFNTIVNAFLAGEVTPKAYSRTDAPLYAQACKTLLNMIVYPQGGAGRRPGSQFISDTYAAKTDIRNIPYNPTGKPADAWMMLLTTDAVTGIRVSDNTAPSIATAFGTTDSTTSSVAFAGLTATELNELQYAQAGSLLFITHETGGTWVIKYESSTNSFVMQNLIYWLRARALGTFVFTAETYRFPTRSQNTDAAALLALSAETVGTGRTLTGSGSMRAFTSSMVGKIFRLDRPSVSGIILVTGFTNTTTMTVEVLKACHADWVSAGRSTWYEGAVSDDLGWFSSVAYHEQRVYFLGTPSDPLTPWGSQIGDVTQFNNPRFLDDADPTTVANTDAYQFTLAASESGKIMWGSAGESLAIGCAEREFTAVGSEGAMGPTDIDVKPRTAHGSAYIQSIRQENVAQFVHKSQQKVRDMVFDFRENSFRSSYLSMFAEHLVRVALDYYASYSAPRIIAMAKQDETIWYIDNNGGLFAQTREREFQVNAWHRHRIGGALSGEAAKVLSIAPSISADGRCTDLWLVVKRTINGGTKLYVEKIGEEFGLNDLDNSSTSIADKAVYMDSCKMVQSAASLTFAGFSHLEGQTVEVVGNGSYLGTSTVTGGSVTIPGVVTKTEVLVGLAYTNTLEILPLDAGSRVGTALGSFKRIDKIFGNFVRTVAAKQGPTEDNLLPIQFRESSVAANEPTPLFTGEKELSFDGTYETRAAVVIKNTYPLPCALSGIVIRGVTHD